MLPINRTAWTVLLVAFPLLAMSCRGPEGTGDAPVQAGTGDEAAIVAGEEVTILAADGSTFSGIAVAVRKRDGTTVPAVFRGPPRLAEVASEGTFEFSEDSLPSRVRLLEPREVMRRRSGRRP